jgi:hypothetical protein
MEINRNQYYMAGLVLLFLGVQFRLVEAVDLKPQLVKMFIDKSQQPLMEMNSGVQALFRPTQTPTTTHYAPPDWWGWMLVSIGSVLVLHSWALPKAP